MARVRIPTEPVLKSWDDVNLTLKEIAEIEIAIEKIENELNEKVSDLKLEAEMQVKPLKDRMEKLAIDLKDFVEMNRADIKGKTKVLNFGRTGFRKSTKIILKNAKAVLASLKARKMDDCIIVKESVNKDKLGEYPDEVIAAVGATKKVEDVFWYETDREKLL